MLGKDASCRNRTTSCITATGVWRYTPTGASAYWGKRRITPLLLDPYGVEAPGVFGENARILAGVDRVLSATNGRGVLVMDRGADRDKLLTPRVDDRGRFVIRLRGDRCLLLDNGALVPALTLAEQLLQAAPDHKRGWRKVYLPHRPNAPLYLVAKTLPGYPLYRDDATCRSRREPQGRRAGMRRLSAER